MSYVVSIWLAYVAGIGAVAYFGSVKQAIAFALVALAMLPASFLTLGRPALYGLPAGEVTVLGARIDVDRAIFLLIDADPEPLYFKIPYSEMQASKLQKAMEGARAHHGKVKMQADPNGSIGFSEEAPKPDAPKG